MKRDHIFIFSGESSGDLHGSYLAKALKQVLPTAHLSGVAGPKMRAQGIQGPLEMENFEVMGFTDVIFALPTLYRQFFQIRDHILAQQPTATVLIDYPGFNLRLAKALRKKGYRGKIIQYISPTVWAWGRQRIQMMADTLDLLLTIYPFEMQHFENSGLNLETAVQDGKVMQDFKSESFEVVGDHSQKVKAPTTSSDYGLKDWVNLPSSTAVSRLNVKYVGNPLCEYLEDHCHQQKVFSLNNHEALISLFPGSRTQEIERNLPFILEAALLLKQRHPHLHFGLSCFHPTVEASLRGTNKKISERLGSSLHCVPREETYELMSRSRLALAKSGTVTLELALHRCPTVSIYKLTLLNRLYAQYWLKLKLPYYCIVNILGDSEIFPELIEKEFSAHHLAEHAERLLVEGTARDICLQGCDKVKNLLKQPKKTSLMAAESIARLLKC